MTAENGDLRGAHVLLLTPFDHSGGLDVASLRSLVEFVIDQGVTGLVGLGTTGEFFTMSPSERGQAMAAIGEAAAGRVPVTFGVGDSSTEVSVELAKWAEASGAEAVMILPPYYYRHVEACVDAHIVRIAEAVQIPAMVYDGAGGIELRTDLLARLSEAVPSIRYVKVATPEPMKIAAIADAAPGLEAFCGDEHMLVLARRCGAVGSTVGIGNVIPGAVSRLEKAADEGQWELARSIQMREVVPLVSVCTMEKAGYIRAYKELLAIQGVIAEPTTRLPLQPLDRLRRDELVVTARELGVI